MTPTHHKHKSIEFTFSINFWEILSTIFSGKYFSEHKFMFQKIFSGNNFGVFSEIQILYFGKDFVKIYFEKHFLKYKISILEKVF